MEIISNDEHEGYNRATQEEQVISADHDFRQPFHVRPRQKRGYLLRKESWPDQKSKKNTCSNPNRRVQQREESQ